MSLHIIPLVHTSIYDATPWHKTSGWNGEIIHANVLLRELPIAIGLRWKHPLDHKLRRFASD